MASKINDCITNQPVYYHREYKNDIPNVNSKESQESSWTDQCKRVTLVALPFISLYKPLSFPLSLAMGGLRSVTCVQQLLSSIRSGNTKEIPYAMLQTAVAVIALAGTIFAHPLGMLISTGHDLIIDTAHLIEHLKKGEHKKAMKDCLGIINNALYLVLFLHGGLEIGIASLAMQILIGLYHSQAEFKEGHYLEGTGHLLMSMVRGNQLAGQARILQTKWRMEDSLKKIREQESKQHQTKTYSEKNSSKEASLDNIKIQNKTEYVKLFALAQSENNNELMDILIKYGNNPKGIPVLHYAIDQNDERAVQLLLQHGASANARAYNGDWTEQLVNPVTALEFAAKNGNINIISILLDHGADLNVITKCENNHAYRWSPALNFACKYDNLAAVNFLISTGAVVNPNSIDYLQMNPVYVATENGSIKALDALSKAGAKLTITFPFGSLLHVAAYANQPQSIRFLIDHGLNVDYKANENGGYTALHVAIIFRKFEAAEELLKNGANINATNKFGWTPFMCIIEYKMPEDDAILKMVKLLVENGADLEFRDDQGRTGFRRLIERYLWSGNIDFNNDGEFRDTVLYLIKQGVDINARDAYNHTILFYALQAKKEAIIKLLLEHHAVE